MLKKNGHIQLRKIIDQELGSIQYLGYHEKILVCFEHQNHVMLF